MGACPSCGTLSAPGVDSCAACGAPARSIGPGLARSDDTAFLTPYLPRLVRHWSADEDSPRWRTTDGSLVSVDISGFTALAERLQAKGKEGAEELVSRISAVFDELIAVAERHGGDVLKFRGDALLLLFEGPRHAERACGAASDMQWTIERVGTQETTLGTVELRMSVGVHTAPTTFLLTTEPHRELLVAGPAATRVFELEDLASAGEIVVSRETAEHVEPAWIDGEIEDALHMRRLPPGASSLPVPEVPEGRNLDAYVPAPLRAHLAVTSSEAEHRQVTVAFLKLPGTDRVLDTGGPEALLAIVDRLAASVATACATYGLTWLESDIDVGAIKLYLTAGAPSTSGDDEEGMLRALRDVMAAFPDLGLRAGVNRGHVFTGDIGAATRRTYAVMGDTVNLAARLCGKADNGEILTTANVVSRTRTMYATTVRPLRVKGKALEIEAHVVGEPEGRRDTDTDTSTRLLGRAAELRILSRAIRRAIGGHQHVVELSGAPGIGKSRLVEEARSLAADAGFEWLKAATDPYSAAEPYGAMRTMLRAVAGITETAPRDEAGRTLASLVAAQTPWLEPWVPLLAVPIDADVPVTAEVELLDAEQSRTRIHEVVDAFLEELLRNPTLIVVEDGHWLDDASEFLLRHLVGRDVRRPWLVLTTVRQGVTPLVAPGTDRGDFLELQPLAEDVTMSLTLELAAELPLPKHAIESLVARAGGNPLFVRELVLAARAGRSIDDLPDTVESLVTSRIDMLDPTDRRLLRFAAVVGPTFELDLLADVVGDEEPRAGDRARWDALTEFVQETRPGVMGFAHDLVRATAYEGLSFGRRRDIHGRLGSVLEQRLGERASEEAALLSLHFHEAGDHQRSYGYAVTAGDRAAAGFANVVAAELYERALAAAASIDVGEASVARVNESMGDVCERFGSYARAHEAFAAAVALRPGPLDRARLLRKTAIVLDRSGHYDEAAATLAESLGALDRAPESAEATGLRAAIEHAFAGTRYRQSRYADAIEHADRAIALAETVGNLAEVARASYIAGASYDDLGRPGALAYLERAVAIYEEIGDDRGLATACNNLGIHSYTRGRWDEAVQLYARARAADMRVGDPVNEAVHANNEAEVLSDQGRLSEAEPLFAGMIRICRGAGFLIGEALGTSNLGRVASRDGRYAEAYALYAEAIRLFDEIGARRYVNETRARVAEALVFEGRHDEALAAAEACLEAARETPFGGLEALVQRMAGYALAQAGRPGEAWLRLRESLRIARALKVTYEEALTLAALADTGAPDGEAARAAASTILGELGVVTLPRVPLP